MALNEAIEDGRGDIVLILDGFYAVGYRSYMQPRYLFPK